VVLNPSLIRSRGAEKVAGTLVMETTEDTPFGNLWSCRNLDYPHSIRGTCRDYSHHNLLPEDQLMGRGRALLPWLEMLTIISTILRQFHVVDVAQLGFVYDDAGSCRLHLHRRVRGRMLHDCPHGYLHRLYAFLRTLKPKQA
jgi:hypothetical protein